MGRKSGSGWLWPSSKRRTSSKLSFLGVLDAGCCRLAIHGLISGTVELPVSQSTYGKAQRAATGRRQQETSALTQAHQLPSAHAQKGDLNPRGRHAPQSLKLKLKLKMEIATSLVINHTEIGVKLIKESLLENILANLAPPQLLSYNHV